MAEFGAGDTGRGTSPLQPADKTGRTPPSAQRAAFELYDTRPLSSAGRRLGPSSALVLGPGLFAIGALAVAPGLAATLLVIVTYGYIAALSLLRLAAAVAAPRYAQRQPLAIADLPVITVIVALYRESEVVAGLCASLRRLNYPREKLDVILVLEKSDTETQVAARTAARRAGFRVEVAPPCGPQTKPRALNYALQSARGALVAVYDAEDAPSADQLIAAAESFAADPQLGVVQAPLGWYNAEDCWLTRQFSLEYAAQFHGLLPLFARLGAPLPLGGTSNVFRTDALKACGAWDPFNVTEDADLGFRLAREGWTAGLIAPGTGEEAPTTLAAWTGQRSRWLKGHLVTWLVQMRDPARLVRRAGWRALIVLQLSVFANVFSAIAQTPGLVLAALGMVFVMIGQAGVLTLTGLLLGAASWLAALVCLWVSAGRAGVKRRPLDLGSAWIYWLCQGPAVWRALKEMGSAPYVWVKTRHGVSKTRREAPHDAPCDLDADGAVRRPVRLHRLADEPAD